ncbi:DNA-3-methyladenine glycosylase 2 [Brevibacillus sp. SYP-B805]|uniref:DNA-3-methyladenine glycosylase family protein n=1 Tax=Brevibacillus sp. SYP-B805 TaxID=1578199 RepID=UPI0013EAB586|nr:DNA-3-methyladenine glycosylase 2 [Brevibacillus sp. SYP-B805]NGQ96676.1 DNA-3-methyladenine glycosylase 2 [Brevibacillus sp. SYP-B805]
MLSFEIPVKPPYSFARLLSRLKTHPNEQLQVDAEAGRLRRALRVDGKPVVVTLQFSGGTETPGLTVFTDGGLTAGQQEELVRTVRHMTCADVDLGPLYELMAADQHLRLLADSFRGLRFLLTPDLFQAMVETIIAQQLNLAFANTLTLRLMRFAGETVEDREGNAHLVFPTPEAVARLEPEALRPLQFSQRKAEYIIDFARAIVSGRIDVKRLPDMSDEEVIGYLTPLRGIGRWTVECLLMFGLGRPDLLPAADIGLRNGIRLVYGLPDKPDEKEIRRLGESWAPWRSYVTLYLWEAMGAARRGEAPFGGRDKT